MTNKPIQLTREEFARALTELVDNTPLPAFVKIDVLSGVNQTLSMIANQEYEQAKEYWEKEQAEEGKKAEEDKGDENGEDKSVKQDKV